MQSMSQLAGLIALTAGLLAASAGAASANSGTCSPYIDGNVVPIPRSPAAARSRHWIRPRQPASGSPGHRRRVIAGRC